MNFSSRLDEAMHHAGFKSQNALAKASGVSQTTINRLLKVTGPSGPDMITIQKLATACGVSFRWLSEGIVTDDPKHNQQLDDYFLVHVSAQELKILSYYRESTIAGKSLLQTMAESLPKKSPPPSIDN